MSERKWDLGATRRVGRVFTRRAPADPPPLDLVGSGELEGALVDWAYYRDGRRDHRIAS
jgi:magnesium transporter